MVNHSQRHAREQDPPHWIEQAHEPTHVFPSVNPDEDIASRSRCPYQARERGFGLLEMVDDSDGEGDVERAFLGDVVDRLTADLDRWISFEIGACHIERTVIEVDGYATRSTLDHCPVAVAAVSAAGVEEACPPPRLPRHGSAPAQELLVVLGQDFAEDMPGKAEAIGRTAANPWIFDHLLSISAATKFVCKATARAVK